jgi:hypothetical protein
MAYVVYEYDSYKEAIKNRIQLYKKSRPHLTLKWLAERVPVQYTYLSMVLNKEKAHLNEDQLYRVAELLEYLPEETDFLLLLRSEKSANETKHQQYLKKKIEQIRMQRSVSAEYKTSNSAQLDIEMKYMLNPLAQLTHVALFINEYQQDPRRLCGHLGISLDKLRELLEILEMNQYIELGEDHFEIKKVHNQRAHFGREHPLMRVAQMLNRSSLQSRMQNTTEEKKEGFFVTFSMDDEGFTEVKKLFSDFLKNVQEVKRKTKNKHLYQMNFDFLKWF